jgi:hypothetical protein
MTSLPLFDQPKREPHPLYLEFIKHWKPHGLARRSDPETSHAAAKSVDANRLESVVLGALGRHPSGLTIHEVADLTGVPFESIGPRFRPLVNKGLIHDSGERRVGRSNRQCIVWRLRNGH